MRKFTALLLPSIASWLAVTAWGLLAVFSPFPGSLWRDHPEAVTYGSLSLVFVPLLWLAAWLFRRLVPAGNLDWAFAAALLALGWFVMPSLIGPVVWPTYVGYFAVGLLVVFPALVWLSSRPGAAP